MSLSQKDSVKILAGLLEIEGRGHDADAVKHDALARMRNGTPEKIAFAAAFDSFAARVPSMAAPIQQVGRQIEASSDRTVAQYNVALRQYLETGDGSGIVALVPTIVKDAADLALRTGEAVPEFGPEADDIVSAANETAPAPPTETHVNPAHTHPATFAFAPPSGEA